MTEPVELTGPDFCIPGTVGPAGRRVFYVQAQEDDQVVTLRCEKQQVAALAAYLGDLLTDLPEPDGPTPERTELAEPVVPWWPVGPIGVGYRDDADRIVLALDELVPDQLDAEVGDERGQVRIHLTRAQASHFVGIAVRLVSAGRPPCPLCGRPVDAEGHTCVKSNGHGHG